MMVMMNLMTVVVICFGDGTVVVHMVMEIV